MKRRKATDPKFAVCVKNRGYRASLELRKIYQVLPDTDAVSIGQLRIIDESGEDYLYPSEWFIAVELPQAVGNALLNRVK